MRRRGFAAFAFGALAASAGSCGGGGARPTSSGQLQIVAKCQSNTTPADIEVAFMVRNTSPQPIAYADVKVRYYFSYQLQSGATPVLDVEFTEELALTDITARFTSDYVELGFTSAAGQLGAPDDGLGSGQILVLVHDSAFSNWDASQADDHSFVSCDGADPTAFVPRPTMTAYVAGKLAWGVEP
jgi:hypothetical protein